MTINRVRVLFASAVLAGALAIAGVSALAQSVAMVTDVTGGAAVQGRAGASALGVMSEIPLDARVHIDAGARLIAVYLASGEEYVFAGPDQVHFHSGEPRSLSGAAPQRRATALAKAGPAIRVNTVAQAGFVMRGARSTGRIRLLSLAGTTTLEPSPEFRWQQANGVARYRLRLLDDRGNPLHESDVEGISYRLPASVALAPGVAYTWELSAAFADGRRYTSSGDFSLAAPALRAQVDGLRPASGAPFAERVLFAAWLEQAQLRDEARRQWQALLAERPDEPALQALAGEVTHPPRSVTDITALLDQYQPDPGRIEALRAALKREPPAGADRDALLRFYVERAQAAQGLGLVARQRADLERALELAKGGEEEWTVMQDIWITELQAGNFATALQIKERMPRLVGERFGRLPADYGNAVFMYTLIGDLSAARSALRNLEAVMWKLGNGRNWERFGDAWTGQLEGARGRLLNAEGRYAEAEAAFRKSTAAAERNLEMRLRYAGDALTPIERAHIFFENTQQRLANNLVLQGRYAEAELLLRDVLQRRLSRLGRHAPPTVLTLGNFARLLNEQGRFRDAEALARTALEIYREIGMTPASTGHLQARRQLGRALVSQRRWGEAVPVFEAMSAEVAGDAGLSRVGRGDPNWGLALIKTGQPGRALEMLEGGLKRTVERLGAASHEAAERRGFLAMALAETGQRARALAEFQEATKVLLARDRSVADEEAGATARGWRLSVILEAYIRLLHEIRNELGQQRAGIDAAAEAFRVADAMRGQGAQRALTASSARAAAGDLALAELVRREQDAKQQIAMVYGMLFRLLNAPADQQLPQVAAQMRGRIQELEKEARAVFSELERRFPAYVNLIHPRPATVEEARAALREREVLVSIATTDDASYVWAVPKAGEVLFHAVPVGGKALSDAVAALRRALDPGKVTLESLPEFDVAAAQRLYAELLKPVEAAWKEAHTLMIVADGALAQLPFAVLPTEMATPAATAPRFSGYAGVPWLVRRVAITQLPAVSTLTTLRSLPPGSASRAPFAGFGDPQFGPQVVAAAAPPASEIRMRSAALPRNDGQAEWVPYSRLAPLPDTREEILAIASALSADPQRDVFVGPAASRQGVQAADLARRRIVAFATHGLVAGDLPGLDQPALALSAPSGLAEEGLLTLEDILALKLDADWVVLSACNTAAGAGQGAEAISGLGRGFFYAGSRSLLVTHWPVETRSARMLVTGLFERYASQPVSRAEALRQASLAVMQQTAQDASGNPLYSYAHPLFWAPYALIGDGGR